MAQIEVGEAIRRAHVAWAAKRQWDSLLGDSMRLVHPHRDGFEKSSRGQKKEGAGEVWDSTAGQAALRGVNRLMQFTPAFEDWIVLEPGTAAELGLSPDDLAKLRNKLQGISKQLNALVQMGDFASAAQEMWLDWLYSTGAMTIDTDMDPAGPIAIFRSVPLSEFTLEEGPHGTVDTWHRRFKITGRSIKIHWPDAKVPEALAGEIERRPEKEIELFEITYRDYDEPKMRFRYEVFYHSGSEKHRLVARQETTSRWVTPRNTKLSGEVLGRGPLLTLMPDIRTLNTVVEITIRASMLQLLGIYTSSDDALNENTVKLRPGTIIRVRHNGGPMGPSLQRLDRADVRLDFSQVIVEQLRMGIKQALFDTGLPPDTGPVRSATEIVQRIRELAVDLGGTYGRIVNEFVVPFVQRLIDILERRGILDTNLLIDQFFIRVRVSSQVARAQSFAQVETIVQWLQIITETGGKEALLLATMIEQIYSEIGRLLGIPEKLIRPPAAQQEMMNKMQQMAQREVAANDTIPPREPVAEAA